MSTKIEVTKLVIAENELALIRLTVGRALNEKAYRYAGSARDGVRALICKLELLEKRRGKLWT